MAGWVDVSSLAAGASSSPAAASPSTALHPSFLHLVQHAGRAGAGQAAANPQRRLTWGSQAEQQKQDEGEEGEGEEDEGGEDDYYLQPVAEGGAASPQQHEQADEEADVWGGFGNADGAAGEEAAQFLGFPAMAGAEAATPDLLGRPASPQPEGAAEPGGGEEQAAEQGPADAPGGGAPHLQLQQHLPENNGLLANNEQQVSRDGAGCGWRGVHGCSSNGWCGPRC